MTNKPFTISVVICTRNRADSLAITMECLANCDRTGIEAEVIVVHNGGEDHTRAVAESFQDRIPVRYLYEPKMGKHHGLNRAMDSGGLGEIVAVLDDDIIPAASWFQGVRASCERWPGRQLFTGHTYVIWPEGEVPKWATNPGPRNWLFSAPAAGTEDTPLRAGSWYSGCHYWFRASILKSGTRFEEMWLSEANFMLTVVEQGVQGMTCPDAVAGHRVQPELLQPEVVLARTRKWGKCCAAVQLEPFRRTVPRACMMARRPLAGRVFCLANCAIWAVRYAFFRVFPPESVYFAERVLALERTISYLEYFRTANRLAAYSPWKNRMITDAAPSRSEPA